MIVSLLVVIIILALVLYCFGIIYLIIIHQKHNSLTNSNTGNSMCTYNVIITCCDTDSLKVSCTGLDMYIYLIYTKVRKI